MFLPELQSLARPQPRSDVATQAELGESTQETQSGVDPDCATRYHKNTTPPRCSSTALPSVQAPPLALYTREGTVTKMRRRYIVGPIMGVWLIAAIFVLRGRETRDATVEITRAVTTASDAWWREDIYYHRINDRRMTLVQQPQTGEVAYENPERVRVLLIGDSFTYGTGLRDMDRRLGVVLEAMLDEATAEGTFEVVVIAYPGASTFTQASWLRKIRDTTSLPVSPNTNVLGNNRIGNGEKLREPFDVVVVGYVLNDIFAGWGDSDIEIPEDYHVEVRRTHGETSVLERYVDMYQDADEQGGNTPNDPYYPLAVRELRSFVGDKPALVMPLGIVEADRGAVDRSMDTFQKAGFTVVNEEASDSVRETTSAQQLMVTAVDMHPGTVLLQAYATDMSEAILASIPSARIAEAELRAEKSRPPLISNYLPLELSINERGTETEIAFDGKFEVEQRCEPYGLQGMPRLTCEGGVTAMYGADGTEWTMQYAPCVPLGRTFAQVMLHTGNLERIEVQLLRGETVQLYSIEYTPSGEELFFNLGTLATGKSIQLRGQNGSADGVRGIAISPIDTTNGGGGGCTTQQPDPVRLAPFTMTIRATNSGR